MRKRQAVLLLSLLMILPMVLLSGCGAGTASSSLLPGNPDSVHIQIDQVTQKISNVTLNNVSTVQQLYTTISSLPQMPDNLSCTMELGPHYTLIFSQAGKDLLTVVAKREGCHPVSIPGETGNRQATSGFWTQLDQAIQEGTPVISN